MLLPAEDWFCKKLENLNLVLIEGYPSKSSEPGGLHVDQFLCPPKSQSRWYGIHPAEPADPQDLESQSIPGLMMQQSLIVPFLEFVNHLLLNPLIAQFLKTLYENGRKQPRKPVTYAISQPVSTDVSPKFRTVFRTTSKLYKLNYQRESHQPRLKLP